MNVPHPIPYQGSKRGIAKHILMYLPNDIDRLIEPFAGSAAVTLAVAYQKKARLFVINDVNEPLIRLWDKMINNPERIAAAYKKLWEQQQGREREFYDRIRRSFNKTQRAEYLLYLLARCVKAAVRYNANGEFNQSPDNRRKGAHPATMMSQILGASGLLRGRTNLECKDYTEVLRDVSALDVVYLDPPYQGVCGGRDRRYAQSLSYDSFVASLEQLNCNNVSFIVSYDGRTGEKKFGKSLPTSLGITHIEIKAGKSSQATLLGRNEDTFESLYLSSALVARIGMPLERLVRQPSLFNDSAERETTPGISGTPPSCKEQTA